MSAQSLHREIEELCRAIDRIVRHDAGDALPDSEAEAPDAAVVCTNSPPDFTLEDVNTISPTYQQNRTLSDTCGRVIILYFALFS